MEVPIPIPPIAIPNEIISKFLSHLGKNDLLKCRLVSQSWNGLSLKILRNPKYGHEHELTQDNIEKFIEFWKERKEEWILPLHLNIECDEDNGDESASEDESVVGMKKINNEIPNYIQQLQIIFGEKCVYGLTLSHESHDSSSSMESVKVLISILTLIAPFLSYLDLSEFRLRFGEEGEAMKVNEMFGKTQLNFPNLSRLISCPPPIWFREDLDEQNLDNNVHSFLIENSQNLKELEVISPYDLLDIHKHNHIGSLRKLNIFNAMEDLVNILEPIRICPTPGGPILNDLSFTYSDSLSVRDHQILNEFLSSFSTSLRRLTVIFEDIPTKPLFPRLSHLRFLGIHFETPASARIQVDPKKLNLNSDTFPALESMDISSNVYLKSTDENSGSSMDDCILGTVKTLIIRVTYFSFNQSQFQNRRIISRAFAKGYVKQLQQLFPNVTSLTIVNDSDGYEEYLNQLLIEFIQSDGAPKIKELEIQNYEKNNLGHILNGLDDPDHEPIVMIKNMKWNEDLRKAIKKSFQELLGGNVLMMDKQVETKDGVENSVITCKAPIQLKMTGLEKIRLSFSEDKEFYKQFGSGIEHESNKMDLFLMNLPKYFPLLRQIDISQRMFGHDKEFCKQQIVNVQDKYPDLIVNTAR